MPKESKRSLIAPVVTKSSIFKKKNDAAYWRTQTPIARLAALEQIRQEYHQWKYDAEPRFQRVYRIIKQK